MSVGEKLNQIYINTRLIIPFNGTLDNYAKRCSVVISQRKIFLRSILMRWKSAEWLSAISVCSFSFLCLALKFYEFSSAQQNICNQIIWKQNEPSRRTKRMHYHSGMLPLHCDRKCFWMTLRLIEINVREIVNRWSEMCNISLNEMSNCSHIKMNSIFLSDK